MEIKLANYLRTHLQEEGVVKVCTSVEIEVYLFLANILK